MCYLGWLSTFYVMNAPLPSTLSWSESDFLALRYRSDLHVLVGRWQRPVSEAELKQGYQAMLRAAQQTNCPFWQLDLRIRQAVTPAATEWLLTEFLPQLLDPLPGSMCLGYLVRPAHLAQEIPQLPASLGVRVAFFVEEGPLHDWLSQCQHRSREALAQAGFTPPPAV